MRTEFRFPEGANRNEYLTKAAKWINSIQNKVELEDGRNLSGELEAYEQEELRNYVYGMILQDVKTESRSKSKKIGLNYEQEKEYESVLQELIVMEFYKYNNPAYMTNPDKRYVISTFIGQIAPRAMRIYLSEDRNLPVNVIRNLRILDKTINSIAREKNIAADDVTPEMVAEALNDVSISVKMIVDLMKLLHGSISMDVMLEENDERLAEYSREDEYHYSDFDLKIKKKLDASFGKFSLTDMCLLMKQYGFWGDDVQKMQIGDFVKTDFYQKLFMNDASIRSKKDPVKNAYNKLAKISAELENLASDLVEYEFDGELEAYCRDHWLKMIESKEK